jgi:hypothetical protein
MVAVLSATVEVFCDFGEALAIGMLVGIER